MHVVECDKNLQCKLLHVYIVRFVSKVILGVFIYLDAC